LVSYSPLTLPSCSTPHWSRTGTIAHLGKSHGVPLPVRSSVAVTKIQPAQVLPRAGWELPISAPPQLVGAPDQCDSRADVPPVLMGRGNSERVQPTRSQCPLMTVPSRLCPLSVPSTRLMKPCQTAVGSNRPQRDARKAGERFALILAELVMDAAVSRVWPVWAVGIIKRARAGGGAAAVALSGDRQRKGPGVAAFVVSRWLAPNLKYRERRDYSRRSPGCCYFWPLLS